MDTEVSHMCCHCGIIFETEGELFLHVGSQHISFDEPSLFSVTGLSALARTPIPLTDIPPTQKKSKRYTTKVEDVKKDTAPSPLSTVKGPFRCLEYDNYEQCSQIFDSCCQYTVHLSERHGKDCQGKCLVCKQGLLGDTSDAEIKDVFKPSQYPLTPRTDIYDKKGKKLQKKHDPRKEKTLISLNGPFKCMQTLESDDLEPCSMVFDDCCQYTRHFLEKHQKRSQTRCLVCERKLNQAHDIGPPDMNQTYQCHLCAQIFLDKLSHDEHYSNHVKVKPYECQKCPKRFSQQSGLMQHERLHTGERPFACTHCPKTFRQKSGLEQHERIHTNCRPYECVVCSKQFAQSAHLRQHMRTHTNLKPFGCEYCGAKFKQVAQLKNHVRHKHEASAPVNVKSEDIEVDVVDHDYCQL